MKKLKAILSVSLAFAALTIMLFANTLTAQAAQKTYTTTLNMYGNRGIIEDAYGSGVVYGQTGSESAVLEENDNPTIEDVWWSIGLWYTYDTSTYNSSDGALWFVDGGYLLYGSSEWGAWASAPARDVSATIIPLTQAEYDAFLAGTFDPMGSTTPTDPTDPTDPTKPASGEYFFEDWKGLYTQMQQTNSGTLHHTVDAGATDCDYMPLYIMQLLEDKPNITLKITYRGEIYTLNKARLHAKIGESYNPNCNYSFTENLFPAGLSK